MTRLRIDEPDLNAEIRAYADTYHITFTAATKIVIRRGLDAIKAEALTPPERSTK